MELGDQLMADKGFDIKGMLEPIGCEITIQAFLASNGQFSKEELLQSKKIHNVRVHVELSYSPCKRISIFWSSCTSNCNR